MVEITDNDVVDLFQKLNKIKNLADSVNNALNECERLLRTTVMRYEFGTKVMISADVDHAIRMECDEQVIEGNKSNIYIFDGSVLEPKFFSDPLPEIHFNYITLKSLVALVLYEKYDGLLTKLIDEARRTDEMLRKRTDILKMIVARINRVAQQQVV